MNKRIFSICENEVNEKSHTHHNEHTYLNKKQFSVLASCSGSVFCCAKCVMATMGPSVSLVGLNVLSSL